MYIYLCTLYYKLSQVSLSLTGIFQIHVNKMSIHMYLRSGTLVQTTHILLATSMHHDNSCSSSSKIPFPSLPVAASHAHP